MALSTLPALALQQVGPFPAPLSDPAILAAGISVVSTLLIGGLLVLAWPRYVEARVDELAANPGSGVAYGVVSLGGLLVGALLFNLTGVGILLGIPLLLAFLVLGAAGSAIGFITIADRLVDRDTGWGVPLVAAALLNGGLALTGIGGVLGSVVAAAGAGPIVHEKLE